MGAGKKEEESFTEKKTREERKRFVFEKTVYLGDTNAEGNVYFTRYFDWQEASEGGVCKS